MKERFEFNYDLLSNWKELPIEEHVLVEQAYAAMENAYAPYSEFKVELVLKWMMDLSF